MSSRDVWRSAVRLGRQVAGPGTRGIHPAEMAAAVAGLRAAAARAPRLVAEVTQLPAGTGPGTTLVVDRDGLMWANATTIRHLLDEAGPELAGVLPPAPVLGAVLGVLASRVLGQFDPLGEQPRLLLVAPNVVRMERVLDAHPDDFRLWVCLHEETHRAQFAAAPWLRAHLIELATSLMAADADEEPWWSDLPRRLTQWRTERNADHAATSLGLISAWSGPATAAALDGITACMSLLEGHADVMMDAVGPAVIPSVQSIRAGFNRQRARRNLAALAGRLLGLDAKMAQYAEGAQFCRRVLAIADLATLNLAFAAPANLPSLDELRAPDTWVARIRATDAGRLDG
ncbi:MAG: zinc-dependent metalloprotease [Actinomycetia bacterium]|nr:zinc-dependent metalloprotease [Actinomycetes bacterium]